jgi:hypothetical protein
VEAGWRYLITAARPIRRTIVFATLAGLSWQAAVIVSPLLVRHAGIVRGSYGVLWWSCPGVAGLVAQGERYARLRASWQAGVAA